MARSCVFAGEYHLCILFRFRPVSHSPFAAIGILRFRRRRQTSVDCTCSLGQGTRIHHPMVWKNLAQLCRSASTRVDCHWRVEMLRATSVFGIEASAASRKAEETDRNPLAYCFASVIDPFRVLSSAASLRFERCAWFSRHWDRSELLRMRTALPSDCPLVHRRSVLLVEECGHQALQSGSEAVAVAAAAARKTSSTPAAGRPSSSLRRFS
jgi:hypothetical protein